MDANGSPAAVDLVDLAAVPGVGGVVWFVSSRGMHANLVVLAAGQVIERHRNDIVDVLIVVLDGTGTATVDEAVLELGPSKSLLVPRGATRSIGARSEMRYLSVHAERQPLTISPWTTNWATTGGSDEGGTTDPR